MKRIIFISVTLLFFLIVAFFVFKEYVRPYIIQNKILNSEYWNKKFQLFKESKTGRIYFVGDSITEYFDLTPLGEGVENRGIGGDFTAGVYKRLDEIVERNPEKVFIMIGINDILANVPEKVTVENYRKILLKIREKSPKTEIFVMSILPVSFKSGLFAEQDKANKNILKINEELKKMCEKPQIKYLALYDSFQENRSLKSAYSKDGVHLNEKGYALLLKKIKQFI